MYFAYISHYIVCYIAFICKICIYLCVYILYIHIHAYIFCIHMQRNFKGYRHVTRTISRGWDAEYMFFFSSFSSMIVFLYSEHVLSV